MVPDRLNGAADSRNQLGQLYNADCKDEGNRLKAYLKTVIVLKRLVCERAWAPSLVYTCVIKSCLPLMSST